VVDVMLGLAENVRRPPFGADHPGADPPSAALNIADCRAGVMARYDVRAVAPRYVAAYRHATRRVRSTAMVATHA
jgi:hypothetical protein